MDSATIARRTCCSVDSSPTESSTVLTVRCTEFGGEGASAAGVAVVCSGGIAHCAVSRNGRRGFMSGVWSLGSGVWDHRLSMNARSQVRAFTFLVHEVQEDIKKAVPSTSRPNCKN